MELKVSISLTVLQPQHTLQVLLVSNACSTGDLDYMLGANQCAAEHCDLFMTDPRRDSTWEHVWHLWPSGDHETEAAQHALKIARCEAVRTLAGTYVRHGLVLMEQPRKFFADVAAVEALDGAGASDDDEGQQNEDAPLTRVVDEFLALRPCCLTQGGRSLAAHVQNVAPEVRNDFISRAASAVQRTANATIKATERCHAGNRRRAKMGPGQSRCWRRQASQHIIAQSRQRFMQTRRNGLDGRKLLPMVTHVKWKTFQNRATKVTERFGVGGNFKRAYINARSAELKGHGHSRSDFDAFRKKWSAEFDSLPSDSTLREEARWLRHCAQRRSQDARNLHIMSAQHQDHDDEAAFGAATHWGMGCTLYPLSADNLQAFIDEKEADLDIRNSRGGIRRLEEQLTPEEGLVMPAQVEKLVLHGTAKACNCHDWFVCCGWYTVPLQMTTYSLAFNSSELLISTEFATA